MSSFIEDGASEISAFASIRFNDAFRRLPTNTHTFIGLSIIFSNTVFQFEATPVRFSLQAATGDFSSAREIGTLTSKRSTAERILKAFHSLAGRRRPNPPDQANSQRPVTLPSAFGHNSWNIKRLSPHPV
jgi:hypothetical protein